LNFGFEYLKDFKVLSRYIQNASNPPTCWDHRLYGHTLRSFFRSTVLQKKRESQQLFLGLRLVSRIFEENQQSAIQPEIELNLGGFFQQIKVRQPIGERILNKPDPDKQEVGLIFVGSGSEL